MKNQLFIEHRKKSYLQPKTIEVSEAEFRHYPESNDSSGLCNSISIQVVNRDKTRREQELIFIQFKNGKQFSGTFEELEKRVIKA